VNADPHRGRPIVLRGPDPAAARLTAILVHGRNASAANILTVADELGLADIAYLAPEAAGRTWYPHSFLEPLGNNEPGLTSALGVLDGILVDLQSRGITTDHVAMLGFSQGACLALEYAARHPRRYAAVVGFSGGVIGPDGAPRDCAGSMQRTPMFIGCSDVDPHIPLARVRETTAIFRRLGASVDERIYPGMGHLVTADEIEAVRGLLGRYLSP
jgi:predicted esterase